MWISWITQARKIRTANTITMFVRQIESGPGVSIIFHLPLYENKKCSKILKTGTDSQIFKIYSKESKENWWSTDLPRQKSNHDMRALFQKAHSDQLARYREEAFISRKINISSAPITAFWNMDTAPLLPNSSKAFWTAFFSAVEKSLLHLLRSTTTLLAFFRSSGRKSL